jgi:hypothetical protein
VQSPRGNIIGCEEHNEIRAFHFVVHALMENGMFDEALAMCTRAM